MATDIIINRKRASAVIHVASANSTIKVSGNSTTTNVDSTSACLATGDETIDGVNISQVFWGIDPSADGHVVIKRGANIVGVYDSTGYKDYAGCGMAIKKDASANLVIEFASSANGYIMIEVQKISSNDSPYV